MTHHQLILNNQWRLIGALIVECEEQEISYMLDGNIVMVWSESDNQWVTPRACRELPLTIRMKH